MPSLDEGQTPKERAIERIAQEIARAEYDRIPTSRQKLSQMVFAEFKIPLPDAANLVDEYCDEKAPGVPFFLQDELESPFLKIAAVVNSILGIGFLYYGAHQWRAQKPSWVLFVLGAVFIGLAGWSFFKILHKELASD